MSLTHLKT